MLALTAIGAMIRFANPGRLGLDHFDEGVYGSAGAWIHLTRGLRDLDPGLIPYAPPVYPVLVGLSYSMLGTGDFAAVLVSIVAGVATILLVGWLGRKFFGPGCGVAASAFAAISGPHIVFSRMALTDATFLLLWIAAIAAGAAFLSEPRPGRSVLLGVAVGLAQLTKYNGWLVGAVVAVAAIAGLVVSTQERSRVRSTLGWGIVAALISAAIYWPWVRFVEAHGSYAALLRHQRGYLVEVSDWPRHLLTQLRQVVALSGGDTWQWASTILATIGVSWSVAFRWESPRWGWRGLGALVLVLVAVFPATSGWWLGIGLSVLFLRSTAAGPRMLGAWWLVLTILTPLYHPYARLWLPIEASGWLIRGFFLVKAIEMVVGLKDQAARVDLPRTGHAVIALLVIGLVSARLVVSVLPPRARPLPDLIGPRDSFRIATARIVAKVPAEAVFLRLLARPTLWYYALGPLGARGVGTVRESSLDELLSPGEGWAIVDTAQLRQEPKFDAAMARLLDRCVVVAEESAALSPATRLDIDSNAAIGGPERRSESLLLVRHKREGDAR